MKYCVDFEGQKVGIFKKEDIEVTQIKQAIDFIEKSDIPVVCIQTVSGFVVSPVKDDIEDSNEKETIGSK